MNSARGKKFIGKGYINRVPFLSMVLNRYRLLLFPGQRGYHFLDLFMVHGFKLFLNRSRIALLLGLIQRFSAIFFQNKLLLTDAKTDCLSYACSRVTNSDYFTTPIYPTPQPHPGLFRYIALICGAEKNELPIF
jgi:hypothetical protein